MSESISYRLALDNAQYVKGMKEAQAEVRGLGASTRSSNLGALSGELQMASGSASTFTGNARGAKGGLLDLITTARAGGGAFGGIAAGATAAGGAIAVFAGTTAAAHSVLSNYAPFDSMVRGLKTLEGTASATRRRIEELREVAKTPGLGFEEAVRADIKLRSVGLSADLSAESLKAFGNAIATVGGGKADLDGVALALTQIAAKGQISAEEINQMAERVPQVRAAMKAAFGTADTEALQKMGVGATEFIQGLVTELAKLPQMTGGARNELDNYSDAWGALKTQATEFGVEISGSWIRSITGAFGQARRDLESLKNLMGVKTPGLEGKDGTTEEQRLAEQAAEAKTTAEAKAANDEAKLHNANLAFWERKQLERTAFLKTQAEERAKIEEDAATRARRAQEEVFAARLSPKANLERQIAAEQAAGPSGADAVNSATNITVAAEIAERTARIVGLQKQLADLQTAAADKAENEAQAAERKATAEAKVLATRKQAAATFALEEQILAARAAGDAKQVKALERKQAVEATTQKLIQQQGLDPKAAATAAERRQKLEEAVAKREENPARIRLTNAEDSDARRTARMSAADKARAARFAGIDAAAGAAAAAVAKPAVEKKDHQAAMVKQLNKLDTISDQLAAVGLAK